MIYCYLHCFVVEKMRYPKNENKIGIVQDALLNHCQISLKWEPSGDADKTKMLRHCHALAWHVEMFFQ